MIQHAAVTQHYREYRVVNVKTGFSVELHQTVGYRSTVTVTGPNMPVPLHQSFDWDKASQAEFMYETLAAMATGSGETH